MLIKRKWTNLCNRLVICCVYQKFNIRRCGGIGRHKGLKIPLSLRPYRFKSGHRHHEKVYCRKTIDLFAFIKIKLRYGLLKWLYLFCLKCWDNINKLRLSKFICQSIIKVWSTFLKINVNYDFKTNKYTFNLTGKRAGTATYKLVYFTGDKTTKAITATINVDSQGMLQNLLNIC